MTSQGDIERRLDDLEPDNRDLPNLTLATILGAMNEGEYETTNDPNVVRCFGDLYYADSGFRDTARNL